MANVLYLFFIMLLLVENPLASSTSGDGFRLTLTHVDSAAGASLTLAERIQRAVRRSYSRKRAIEAKRNVVAPVSFGGELEYLVSFGIGSPALPVTAILDTGSDLIWTQCLPSFERIPQPTPFYDSSESSSFSRIPCSNPFCSANSSILSGCASSQGDLCLYLARYGDDTHSRGLLATETLRFGDRSSIAGVIFGCGFWNNGTLSNSTGIVGMGRGRLSLPAQLNHPRFSYCFTSINSSAASHLFLGTKASLGGGKRGGGGSIGSTPFISNPIRPTFYYISLIGISLGGTRLPIPPSAFQLNPDGSNGTIIDSGTFLTVLNQPGYDILRKELIKQARLPLAESPGLGIDLCFSLKNRHSAPRMPELVFHFDGADMRFQRDKYMIYDPEEGLFCSAIAGTDGLSILGNYQQQDMHILYDLKANVLSFVLANCDLF
ncbi:aspartic proteinase nepenthesin-1-like [Curcuma longa]|uniref:aspartic proteinase nepenthesin-1-like n=1 Tax=Curcuma longa TaxID=136217 RepID=UPI003D9E3CA8